jgi:hypothetical protein
MSSDANAGSAWERVAAELRACKEAQQRAWGDIDNTTLGRYLADEVSREEREHIESALEELPELRKLTALVRDVLDEPEAVVSEPMSVPYGPAILPFPQTPALPSAAARPTSPLRSQPPGPARQWNERVPAGRFRQRAGLLAAAAMLLTLGVALPRSGTPSSPSESALALSRPMASHDELTSLVALTSATDALSSRWAEGEAAQHKQPDDRLLARIDASVQALEAQGKPGEAKTLARQYASNLTRQALFFQEKGDLARAEPVLNQARTLCARTLGPQAPETVRSRNTLAGVYEIALNTASPAADARRAAEAPAPAVPSADAPRRGYTAPLHSASSYGPPMPSPRVSGVSTPQLMRQKLLAQQKYEQARLAHALPAPQAAVVLRERLTSQSQSELRNSVVPVLTQALRETADAAERQRLTWALGQLGPAAREAVPTLIHCYRQATDVSERSAVLLALGQIGPPARQAVPVLLESLRSDSARVRACACQALVQLGPAARSWCRNLAKKDGDNALVREVMRRIDGPEGRIGIDDECECFSLKTIQQGQREIGRLAKTYHVEVLVETASPSDKGGASKAEDRPAERGKYSVYLRINKDAPSIQVYVSEALQKQGLTDTRLREVLEPYVKNKEYDRSLREGIRFLAHFEKELANGKR